MAAKSGYKIDPIGLLILLALIAVALTSLTLSTWNTPLVEQWQRTSIPEDKSCYEKMYKDEMTTFCP